ncbi:hypothetical protein [Candidatus Hodgkinia cicadicola]|uniref:hypothetical protein n=1 Tax=Candidatus Hodgkinia cicadicola TaxID=573658 RepID=UPI0011BAE0A7
MVDIYWMDVGGCKLEVVWWLGEVLMVLFDKCGWWTDWFGVVLGLEKTKRWGVGWVRLFGMLGWIVGVRCRVQEVNLLDSLM